MPHLDLTQWMSLIALIIALSSALVGALGYRLARKSYLLAEGASRTARPQSSLYLIDAFRWREADRVLYVFCVSIENKSTVANSIVDVEMRLPYRREGKERLAVLPLNNSVSDNPRLMIKNAVQIPAIISARGALTATFCFRLATDLIDGAEFDEHVLRIKFADGEPSELKRQIIQSMTNVQELENKRQIGIPI